MRALRTYAGLLRVPPIATGRAPMSYVGAAVREGVITEITAGAIWWDRRTDRRSSGGGR